MRRASQFERLVGRLLKKTGSKQMQLTREELLMKLGAALPISSPHRLASVGESRVATTDSATVQLIGSIAAKCGKTRSQRRPSKPAVARTLVR